MEDKNWLESSELIVICLFADYVFNPFDMILAGKLFYPHRYLT